MFSFQPATARSLARTATVTVWSGATGTLHSQGGVTTGSAAVVDVHRDLETPTAEPTGDGGAPIPIPIPSRRTWRRKQHK